MRNDKVYITAEQQSRPGGLTWHMRQMAYFSCRFPVSVSAKGASNPRERAMFRVPYQCAKFTWKTGASGSEISQHMKPPIRSRATKTNVLPSISATSRPSGSMPLSSLRSSNDSGSVITYANEQWTVRCIIIHETGDIALLWCDQGYKTIYMWWRYIHVWVCHHTNVSTLSNYPWLCTNVNLVHWKGRDT